MAKISKTDSFQLKADFLPITILRLLRNETDLLQAQLEQTIQKAPQFFENAPIILDTTELDDTKPYNIKEICDILRACKIHPIAGRGLKDSTLLPALPNATQKQATKNKLKESSGRSHTKIIDKPVRAGTQIYAKNGDLIILAPVNSGAEVIADGNIHVYAPLRGRALAGANGDMSARIFTTHCEAELIAIAGRYWLNEKLKSLASANKLVQIYLKEDELHLASL